MKTNTIHYGAYFIKFSTSDGMQGGQTPAHYTLEEAREEMTVLMRHWKCVSIHQHITVG